VFKVGFLGGSQITRFYSKKLNANFRFQVNGNDNVPKGEP